MAEGFQTQWNTFQKPYRNWKNSSNILGSTENLSNALGFIENLCKALIACETMEESINPSDNVVGRTKGGPAEGLRQQWESMKVLDSRDKLGRA